VRQRTADRLVRQAIGRGPLARWAAQRLLQAGEAGDPEATDAVWELWLRDGSTEHWAALTRWRRPMTGEPLSLVALGEQAPAAAVIEAVRRPGHPIADIALARIRVRPDLVEAMCAAAVSTEDPHLVRLCGEHDLVPEDPRQAAMFFLLTGQRERYRLADPNHSLLALTYRGASTKERARIQSGVVAEPDLVRVLADSLRRDRMAGLTPGETRYLVDGFAQRKDWPTLWALAKDLPVREAVDAVRQIHDWRPGDGDAPLFDILAGADPKELLVSRTMLRNSWARLIPMPGIPVAGAFARDGRRFAVAHQRGVEVYAMPASTREPENSRAGRGIHGVLVLDDGQIVTAGIDLDRLRTGFVERGGGGRPVTREVFPGVVTALAERPGGYVALTVIGENAWLRLPDGTLSVRDGLNPDPSGVEWTLAADQDRLAVAGVRLSFLEGTRLVPAVAPFTTGRHVTVRLAGPGRLIAADDTGTVRVWRETAAGEWEVAAQRQFGTPVRLVHLPAVGEIAALADDNRPAWYLDATTLADVPGQRPLIRTGATCLFASRDGTVVVSGRAGVVEVSDVGAAAVTALADRPLGAAAPADLHLVNVMLAREGMDSPLLELLRTCLEHRFGADVALGGAGMTVRADDIGLA
jgi:hypothetical protein